MSAYYLAWDMEQSSRDKATRFPVNEKEPFAIAEELVQKAWGEEPLDDIEIGDALEIPVMVVLIEEDGSEQAEEFTVYVELVPTFCAYPKRV